MPSLAATILAAASVACAAAGAAVGTAFLDMGRTSYGGEIGALAERAAATDAAERFSRADADGSGALSADEFASTRLVAAELSRLNGFVTVVGDAGASRIALSRTAQARPMLTEEERARVLATAYRQFHALAGADASLSQREYAAACAASFALLDRDGDFVLKGDELFRFGAAAAALPGVDA